jgi:hypothetical protein
VLSYSSSDTEVETTSNQHDEEVANFGIEEELIAEEESSGLTEISHPTTPTLIIGVPEDSAASTSGRRQRPGYRCDHVSEWYAVYRG